MKTISNEDTALIGGGEMTTPSLIIIFGATLVSPLLGGVAVVAYYAKSDLKEC